MSTSAILCARNDNYGGNLNERATHCLNSMIDTFDVVYYVDWNSPNGHSLLWDIEDDLNFRGNLHHVVIDPTNAAIMTHHDPHAQKCCEVLARNIGIRKAVEHSEWVVSTNIDIVAPRREDLESFLSDADPYTFYTISRRNTPDDWEREWTDPKRWIEFRDMLYDTIGPRDYSERLHVGDDYSIINCCGDFQVAHSNIWSAIRGFEESMIYSLYSDTNVQAKAVAHGFRLKAVYEPPLFHIEHGPGGGGFVSGINKKANDPALSRPDRTHNANTWGFSTYTIETEVL